MLQSCRPKALLPVLCSLLLGCGSAYANQSPDCKRTPQVCLGTLGEIALPAMRDRDYGSAIKLLKPVEGTSSGFIVSYTSDGLRLYARMDFPSSPAPQAGYPVVVLAPGWISREQALDWDFGADPASTVATVRQGLLDSGLAVVTAGYRGRGKVDGVPAQGMEFRDAWGNGSYISPMFYAIDVLNLVAGLHKFSVSPAKQTPSGIALRFDPGKVSLWGHSQGGDVASTVLAVVGRNSRFSQPLLAASIWSGNIPDRFTQANTFGPMGSSLEAFMSGDGSWTGSATGSGGEVNPDFVFAWPADWIGTLDTGSNQWTWQAQQWSTPTVAKALQEKYSEMYLALNRYVGDISGANFKMERDSSGRSRVSHDPQVAELMPLIGAYHHAGFIDTPVALHASDRDYYSIPEWNHSLARQINSAGGSARVYIYPGTNHGLRRSKHEWFSPPGTADGVPVALARDIALFQGAAPPD